MSMDGKGSSTHVDIYVEYPHSRQTTAVRARLRRRTYRLWFGPWFGLGFTQLHRGGLAARALREMRQSSPRGNGKANVVDGRQSVSCLVLKVLVFGIDRAMKPVLFVPAGWLSPSVGKFAYSSNYSTFPSVSFALISGSKIQQRNV